MTALSGSFVSLKTMADGTCRVTLDLDCPITEFVALNGGPGSVWALARITDQAASPIKPILDPVEPLGPIAKWAVMRCKEPAFWNFLADVSGHPIDSETECKEVLCMMAGVQSRRELDDYEAKEWVKQHIIQKWNVSKHNPHRQK